MAIGREMAHENRLDQLERRRAQIAARLAANGAAAPCAEAAGQSEAQGPRRHCTPWDACEVFLHADVAGWPAAGDSSASSI